jgi:uncharacterized protein with HEPN domain
MYSEKIRLRLQHIVENSDRISEYIAGMDFETFSGHRMTIDAVERCLSRITEASVRVGEAALNQIAPGVPMHVLRGFGNALRHDYDLIDLPTIWKTIQNDLPALRAACERALAEG